MVVFFEVYKKNSLFVSRQAKKATSPFLLSFLEWERPVPCYEAIDIAYTTLYTEVG